MRRPGVWLLALLPAHALVLALAPAPTVEAVYGQALFPIVARVHAALDATPISPGVTLGVALLLLVLGGALRTTRSTAPASSAWSASPAPTWSAAATASIGSMAGGSTAGGSTAGVQGGASPSRARRFLRASAWRLLVVAAALAHAFSPSWGLNYRRPSVGERLGLVEAGGSFGRTADRVVRATNAARVPWGRPDLAGLERAVDEAVQRTLRELGLAEAAVPGRRVRLLPPRLMAVGGWAGVTLPWTTEAMVDPAIDPRSLPHCMAHEKAHQAGFAREADANFIAWLSLVRSDDPRLRYSTLFFVVDLFVDDAQVPLEPDLVADAREAVAIQKAVQVPAVRSASERVYDTYLRANEVQAGIADYDGVARLIHAWLQRHPETLPE
ncbi:MAG: DUF3810 family protein [Planctomycetes bacterium]|nr:DUF3810 family protein [Planctomycetota bacterium]